MTDWTLFGAATVLLAGGFVLLARRSADPADLVDRGSDAADPADGDPDAAEQMDAESGNAPPVPPALLLVNVVVVNATFGGLLVGAAWVADVPAAAFGVPAASGTPTVLAGDGALDIGTLAVGLGIALYLGGEVGGAVARALGRAPDESARESLVPRTRRGWALLLFVVLPLGAAFEELLFRGALVGALAAGFGVDPWVLVPVSAAAFGVGHEAQGTGGVWLTAALGAALAAAFVLTGSLALVVVAHFVANALEFGLREGLDVSILDHG